MEHKRIFVTPLTYKLMQPGSDSLAPLWQKYSSVFPPTSLEHSHLLQQRSSQLQLLFDYFRCQMIKDNTVAARNAECAITSSGSITNMPLTEVDVGHRFKSKLPEFTAENVREGLYHHLPLSGSDKPQVDSIPPPCLPLFKQINYTIPGLNTSTLGKSPAGSEKSCFLPPNPNILAHLAHLHRLAMTIFSHQNVVGFNTGVAHENNTTPLNSSSDIDLSGILLNPNSFSFAGDHANSSTIPRMQSLYTTSNDLKSMKIKEELASFEQQGTFRNALEGLNLSLEPSKSLESHGHTSYTIETKGSERNVFGYPFPDRDLVPLRQKPSFHSGHDLWASSLVRPMHSTLPLPLSNCYMKKLPHKSPDTVNKTHKGMPEPVQSMDGSRLVRLSNCSLKPIDQLTVSDFVASALHPTANGHASPVAASLTEALLNQCGLELAWVKLAHIRERSGAQTARLLFNVSSKRHRLPIGTTERIQGRHSSRMLWPQFSGKSFKMHKKLSFDARKDQPFFVHALGWSSIDPCATWKHWGLVCRQLTLDDICLVLIRQLNTNKKPRTQPTGATQKELSSSMNPVMVSANSRSRFEQTNGAVELPCKNDESSGVFSLNETSLNTASRESETNHSADSVHGLFPRNNVTLKRNSSERYCSSLMKIEKNDETNDAESEVRSKKVKTDNFFWRSPDCIEKSIFFSATSLAQSHESVHNAEQSESSEIDRLH